MKLVQHPNVVRLYEVIDTQTKLYLILELGDGGDLYDYIMRHDSGLSEEVLLPTIVATLYAVGLQLPREHRTRLLNSDAKSRCSAATLLSDTRSIHYCALRAKAKGMSSFVLVHRRNFVGLYFAVNIIGSINRVGKLGRVT